MHPRTPVLYFVGTLLFTSHFCNGAETHPKNTSSTSSSHQATPHTSSSKMPWKLCALGIVTTSVGFLWYQAISYTETVFCEDRVDPCFPGTESSRSRAQLLMGTGATMIVAGAASLLEFVSNTSKK